jgi:hypothetical protein
VTAHAHAQTVFHALGDDFGEGEEHAISYLPLSHVAAQVRVFMIARSVVSDVRARV